ncbi:outer dense fiber protein 3B-like [Cimex lectularius]|uniref:Outer dense fiber protein 3 n=1 Tax=Cimex lectularius TaxID=79782 RepID=A0A8I6RQI5_CIMLE|nr:outer dense fiber protein 3B-like [Cimex lectularius]
MTTLKKTKLPKKKKMAADCGPVGPGPAKYLLPPMVGYENHAVNRWRGPAFSFRTAGVSSVLDELEQTPGPIYNVSGLTRFGKIKSHGFKIKSKGHAKTTNENPGPGEYSPERPSIMIDFRQPGYSIAGRHVLKQKQVTPGPNQYIVPDCLGQYVPHLASPPSFSIYGRHQFEHTEKTPGPGDYLLPDTQVYKYRSPRPIMPTKAKEVATVKSPGPTEYCVDFKPVCKSPPAYTFGIRPPRCKGVFATPLDNLI